MTTIATAGNASTRRFTADEVLRMVELGVIREDERVELLEGELVVVTPPGPNHASLSAVLARLLASVLPDRMHVRQQSPFLADPYSLPEPDLTITKGQPRDWMHAHPEGKDLHLAVEISVTSQRLDRAKAALYARAGVREYWLIDVPARRVIAHRDPDPEGHYRSVTVLGEGDSIELAESGTRWTVKELLP